MKLWTDYQFRTTFLTLVFNISANNRASHTPSHAAAQTTIYSASQENNATTFCFCEHQLTGLDPRKDIIPKVLFQSSISLA
jgi:hypothetical protein